MSVCFFKVGRDIEFNLWLVSSLLSIFVLLLQSHYTFVIDDKFLNTAFYMAIFALMFTPDSSFLKTMEPWVRIFFSFLTYVFSTVE